MEVKIEKSILKRKGELVKDHALQTVPVFGNQRVRGPAGGMMTIEQMLLAGLGPNQIMPQMMPGAPNLQFPPGMNQPGLMAPGQRAPPPRPGAVLGYPAAASRNGGKEGAPVTLTRPSSFGGRSRK